MNDEDLNDAEIQALLFAAKNSLLVRFLLRAIMKVSDISGRQLGKQDPIKDPFWLIKAHQGCPQIPPNGTLSGSLHLRREFREKEETVMRFYHFKSSYFLIAARVFTFSFIAVLSPALQAGEGASPAAWNYGAAENNLLKKFYNEVVSKLKKTEGPKKGIDEKYVLKPDASYIILSRHYDNVQPGEKIDYDLFKIHVSIKLAVPYSDDTFFKIYQKLLIPILDRHPSVRAVKLLSPYTKPEDRKKQQGKEVTIYFVAPGDTKLKGYDYKSENPIETQIRVIRELDEFFSKLGLEHSVPPKFGENENLRDEYSTDDGLGTKTKSIYLSPPDRDEKGNRIDPKNRIDRPPEHFAFIKNKASQRKMGEIKKPQ